jgi:YidC/Oxa1 family membrane protein insertase
MSEIGIFSQIWQLYLYQPLVNLLVYLYNTIAGGNLGWAIVSLTVCLRLVLLPLSILSERNKLLLEEMQKDIGEAERHYRADPIYLKEHVRGLMKKYHIRPWAKTVSLAIQLFVLVLLYQVFITGVSSAQLAKILYPFVDYPGKLNTIFFTVTTETGDIMFDVGQRSLLAAAVVGLVLFIDIAFSLRKTDRKATKSDLLYWIVFPLASFLILWYLPMVKALFIITSIVFSYVVSLISKRLQNKKDGHGAHH